jgi:hypothetical protein
MSEEAQWTVRLSDGRTLGPFTVEELRHELSEGAIEPDSLSRRGDGPITRVVEAIGEDACAEIMQQRAAQTGEQSESRVESRLRRTEENLKAKAEEARAKADAAERGKAEAAPGTSADSESPQDNEDGLNGVRESGERPPPRSLGEAFKRANEEFREQQAQKNLGTCRTCGAEVSSPDNSSVLW